VPRTIIESFPKEKRAPALDGSPILRISECFTDTIQGENFVGVPATFLRLQGCILNCNFCDTTEVWRKGNPYSVKELLDLWKKTGVIDNFRKGQHLVITGGSPLAQQKSLLDLLETLEDVYNFSPYTEIENEAVLMVKEELIPYIDCWNNSPKLRNSGNPHNSMYLPEVIKQLASFDNSWFKFVINTENDWQEIEEKFLKPDLIHRDQIVLMPEGMTREELQKHYEFVVNMAVKQCVRMTNRLHVTIWNKKIGV
jgi:7-carboxy-7-deazaguanine synthase